MSDVLMGHIPVSLLDEALEYARRGWAILPLYTPIAEKCSCGHHECNSIGKHPRTAHGVKDATTDEGQIRAWWERWPDANLGIATGNTSAIVVIDIDSSEGEQTIKDMCGGTLPETLTCRTGKGLHLLFLQPHRGTKNQVQVLPGVDIRGDGGYVVAPPSLHVLGNRYTWIDKTIDPSQLPESLFALLQNKRDSAVATSKVAPILQGTRNSILTRYTGSLLGKGYEPSDVSVLAHNRNKTYCNPPLSDEEVNRLVESIVKTDLNKKGYRKAELVQLDTVEQESVTWLWQGWIPYGKVTVLDGNPGLGKSTLAIAIAAAVTAGHSLPDTTHVKTGNVLIIACEDGIADTIKPRLIAARGDAQKCFVLTGVYDKNGSNALCLPEDIDVLKTVILEHQISFVIVDPLLGYISGKIDSHKDQHIRRVMGALARLAEESGAAILVIRHLNKGEAGSAIYRGMGSIGITAVARSVILIAPYPDNDAERVLASVKLNLGPKAASLHFRFLDSNGTGRVDWVGATFYTADVLVQGFKQKESADHEVDTFLKECLSTGPLEKKVVIQAATAKGLRAHERTLRRRLSEKLNGNLIVGGKPGLWGLPDKRDISSQQVQSVQIVQEDHLSIVIEPIGDDGQNGQGRHSSTRDIDDHLEKGPRGSGVNP